MTDMIVFYTHPMSRGRIVRWMLEEVGCAYRTEILDYASGMKSDAYRAINPMGKVPAIVHRGAVVTECAAICAYLADAFPEAGLAPPPAHRADYYRWLFFAAGPIEAAVADRARNVETNEAQRRMVGYGSFDEMLDAAEGAVAGRAYITGTFSAADVYLGSQLGWGMQFGTIPERPAFREYVDRLHARPAHLRATELDDALIAATA